MSVWQPENQSLVLGLNTYGHFALHCLDSVNLIKSITLPILSGYLESVFQVFPFLKHKPHKHKLRIFQCFSTALKPKDVRVLLPVQLILDCHWLVCVRGEGLTDKPTAILWTHQNKVFAVIKQTVYYTLTTASWHIVANLLTVSRMSKVDDQNEVLPISDVMQWVNPEVCRCLWLTGRILNGLHHCFLPVSCFCFVFPVCDCLPCWPAPVSISPVSLSLSLFSLWFSASVCSRD